MRVANFTKKTEVEQVLGAVVMKAVNKMLALESGPFNRKFRRVPSAIEFHSEKPTFNLHDFETMTAYAVNIETGEVLSSIYCGSGLSTINHRAEQLGEGFKAPKGHALIFLTQSHGGGGNTAYYLDIVTDHITPQIEAIAKELNARG